MADTQVWILRLGDLIKLAAMRSRSAAADAALIALRRWGEHGERQCQCCAERVGPRAEAYVLTFGEDRLRPESVGGVCVFCLDECEDDAELRALIDAAIRRDQRRQATR